MKPNKPNTELESKTFAKLPGFSIVGRSVSQTPSGTELSYFDEPRVRRVAEQVFKTTAPSMIAAPERGEKGDKGDKGDPGIPDAKTIVIRICTVDGSRDIEVYAPKRID